MNENSNLILAKKIKKPKEISVKVELHNYLYNNIWCITNRKNSAELTPIICNTFIKNCIYDYPVYTKAILTIKRSTKGFITLELSEHKLQWEWKWKFSDNSMPKLLNYNTMYLKLNHIVSKLANNDNKFKVDIYLETI